MGWLEPTLAIDGAAYVFHIAEMAVAPSTLLTRATVADLSGSDHWIRGALEMVISGV